MDMCYTAAYMAVSSLTRWLRPPFWVRGGCPCQTPNWLLTFYSPGGSMCALCLRHGRQHYSYAGVAPYVAVWGTSIHVCRVCTNPTRDVLTRPSRSTC